MDVLKECVTLLNATKTLLQRQDENDYTLNLLEEIVEYHGTDCDGYCLLADITELLDKINAQWKVDLPN